MNWLHRIILIAGFLAGCHWLASNAGAQTGPLEGSPNAALVNTNFQLGVNLLSYRGVPLSTTNGNPVGSDGRAPTVAAQTASQLTTVAPTPLQFQGFVTFSGLPVGVASNLNTNLSFTANAQNLNWPVGLTNNSVAVVLRSALVGAPYVIQQSFLFIGSIVGVPNTDETGHLFGPGTVPENYWLAEPFTTNNHATDPFYWSPNAQAVFAVQPGQMAITWKKAQPYTIATLPPDYSTNQSSYVTNSGFVYRLYTVHYLVSGAAAKPPQTIFWTEGSFQNLGKPVDVPPARVSEVNIVYNNNFPRRVTNAYVDPDQTPIVAGTTNSLQETRTLWFDSTRAQILAYNIEGRVFVELLGELNADGVTRRYLGYEVVDVVKQAPPVDITINLGDLVTAYQDGRDDSALFPAPLLTSGQSFYYQQSTPGSDRLTLYATRETHNLNDFLTYWLDAGVAGLHWPLVLDRYHLVWPSDVSKYSQYLRPQVDTEAEAALTAAQLPTQNAPFIQYQDPLDQPRGKLTETFAYYTFLQPQFPAHRGLLRFTSGNLVSFERVFSWLDTAVKSPAGFAGSVATNLTGWDPTNHVFNFGPNTFVAPYIISKTVNVGDRITAPANELGGVGTNYWAGYINETNGNAYNPGAYINPFVSGFTLANQGAIMPVNANPDNNLLEVWWFRSDNPDGALGFRPTYWPTVIGKYTLQWPTNASQIIMANNAGSGVLSNLQARGTIYYQNDPTKPGYNPNEEHAVILSGTVYALRDDLNVTTHTNHEYSSDPFVLLNYNETDTRPAMKVFEVRREAPEQGVLFDYIVEAGTLLQAPMPLPLLNPPVEGAGASAINYNTEPDASSGDVPVGWNNAVNGNGPYSYYPQFTFQDRKNEFWVYRGLHAGLPPLQSGSYDPTNNVFDALPDATAVVGSNFQYYVHVSRRLNSLTMSAAPALPSGLGILGTAIMGVPNSPGSNTFTIVIEDTGDKTFTTNTLSLNVVTNGTVVAQGPLSITSTNQYSGATVTYVGRPPNLAQPPMPTNSFTMRFYYKTEPGFAWPGVATPPTNGSIVPYLRPYDGMGNFVGDATLKTTPSLDIVYRPVWPASPPTLFSGDTLTVAKNGIAAVRGQTSVQLLYQQSIGEDINDAPFSAVLEDPTREKLADIAAYGLTALPPSVKTDTYQGKIYFPNLPPHLANRFFFDPNRGTNGSLVLIGQFMDDVVGEKYLLLNVLRDADLATVENLCPDGDTLNKPLWKAAVDGLSASVQTFYENPLVPGQYIPNPALTVARGVGDLVEVDSSDTAVDSYGISASGREPVISLTLPEMAGHSLRWAPHQRVYPAHHSAADHRPVESDSRCEPIERASDDAAHAGFGRALW